ncbi:MAG: DUF3098 domain-containing protein [Cyclobacteriaceae bacterium]|jgi:hypothetical protein|nr:DUF3098 domain-containing protein [Cyclobacteriaceae bacterium]
MSKLAFGRRNYQLMVLGVILLAVGFTVMAMDKEPYGFGFLGLTLSPIIVLGGFITEIFAILYTPKEKK